MMLKAAAVALTEERVFWSHFCRELAKMKMDPDLKAVLYTIASKAVWPSAKDKRRSKNEWTASILLAELAELNKMCRSTLQRRLLPLKAAGIIVHEATERDWSRHEPWKFTLNMPRLQEIWSQLSLWGRSEHAAVRILRDWAPWRWRRKQGPVMAARGLRRPTTNRDVDGTTLVDTTTLEEVAWGLAQANIPAELLRRTGGFEPQVKSVVRVLKYDAERWQEEFEVVSQALTITMNAPTINSQNLIKTLRSGRRMWDYRTWPKRVGEARQVLQDARAREIIASGSMDPVMRSFWGHLTLADGLARLRSAHPELMVTAEVDDATTDHPTLFFADPSQARALVEVAEELLQQMTVTVRGEHQAYQYRND